MTDYKNLKLRASSNPHIRNGEDTRGLMLDVIIALMPALLFGVWHFGVRVAISAVVSVASAIFFEWLYRKLLHKPQMIGDLSAAVTGLLLSMVNKKAQEFDKDMGQAMYECLLCDACTNDCATGYQPPLFIREARTEAVIHPIAGLDDLHRLVRGGQFLLVQRLKISKSHVLFLPVLSYPFRRRLNFLIVNFTTMQPAGKLTKPTRIPGNACAKMNRSGMDIIRSTPLPPPT